VRARHLPRRPASRQFPGAPRADAGHPRLRRSRGSDSGARRRHAHRRPRRDDPKRRSDPGRARAHGVRRARRGQGAPQARRPRVLEGARVREDRRRFEAGSRRGREALGHESDSRPAARDHAERRVPGRVLLRRAHAGAPVRFGRPARAEGRPSRARPAARVQGVRAWLRHPGRREVRGGAQSKLTAGRSSLRLRSLLGTIQARSMPEPHDVLPGPGTLLGAWRLERLIHLGAGASVYRARTVEGAVGALKLLHASPLLPRLAGERFAREITVLQGLAHPAIPRVLDHGIEERGLPWFVTEWLAGWDLETHRLRLGGRLPIAELIELGARLLEALGHAHHAGFVHRDVKPQNLFLTESFELRVLDFGVCRALAAAASLTGDNAVIGTPGYMAPEQAARRSSRVDARADIWSVGATLFRLASGHPVHEGTPEEQRLKTYREPARSLATVAPELPADFVAVVDRALMLDPDARFQSANEMRAALLARSLDGARQQGTVPVPTVFAQTYEQRTTEEESELPTSREGPQPVVL